MSAIRCYAKLPGHPALGAGEGGGERLAHHPRPQLRRPGGDPRAHGARGARLPRHLRGHRLPLVQPARLRHGVAAAVPARRADRERLRPQAGLRRVRAADREPSIRGGLATTPARLALRLRTAAGARAAAAAARGADPGHGHRRRPRPGRCGPTSAAGAAGCAATRGRRSAGSSTAAATAGRSHRHARGGQGPAGRRAAGAPGRRAAVYRVCARRADALPRGGGPACGPCGLVGADAGRAAGSTCPRGTGAGGAQPRQPVGPGAGRPRAAPARARCASWPGPTCGGSRAGPAAQRHAPDPDRARAGRPRRARARPSRRCTAATPCASSPRASCRGASACGRAAASAGSRARAPRRRSCCARSTGTTGYVARFPLPPRVGGAGCFQPAGGQPGPGEEPERPRRAASGRGARAVPPVAAGRRRARPRRVRVRP